MNTQVHETTGYSPYELIFGQKPRTMRFVEGEPTVIKEEDLERDGVVFEDDNVNYTYSYIGKWFELCNISKDDHDHLQPEVEQEGIVLEDKVLPINIKTI